MQTDFEEFRKWRHYTVACAIVVLVLTVADFALAAFLGSNRCLGLGICMAVIITMIMSFKCVGHWRCPHCGRFFMSNWGRDAAGRNCAKRIEKRLPILCFHCGQEIDTEN